MKIPKLSNCCIKKAILTGRTTKYYWCSECKKACDLAGKKDLIKWAEKEIKEYQKFIKQLK